MKTATSASAQRILVTGGAGFIGQNFVKRIVADGVFSKVVILDALTYAANPTSLEPLIRAGEIVFERGDITDMNDVTRCLHEHGINRIAHFAAESHVDRSIAGPDAFIQTNIIGTYNLLKCALAKWQQTEELASARFLHVSTDEVFGDLELDENPFTETTPYKPNSPYSASKAASDHLARAYQRTFGLPVLVTNCSNNYGPYQHPEKLIPLMIINCLLGAQLPIYGDGMNVRDWLFVEDHCTALATVLARGSVGQTYNIGGSSERTNRQIVSAICANVDKALAGSPALAAKYPKCPAASGSSCQSLISFVRDRPGHDRRYAIDPSFLQQELGFVPAATFEKGLHQTVMWYLENDAWWRKAITLDFNDWLATNYGGRSVAADPKGLSDDALPRP